MTVFELLLFLASDMCRFWYRCWFSDNAKCVIPRSFNVFVMISSVLASILTLYNSIGCFYSYIFLSRIFLLAVTEIQIKKGEWGGQNIKIWTNKQQLIGRTKMIKTILNVFRSRRVDFYFFLCCPRGNDTMMNLSSVVFFSFLFRLFVVCDIHKLFFF